VIDNLPSIEITKGSCSVCQEEYISEIKALELPCKHHFHSECLLPWLKLHNSCPICRHELITEDEDYNKRNKLIWIKYQSDSLISSSLPLFKSSPPSFIN